MDGGCHIMAYVWLNDLFQWLLGIFSYEHYIIDVMNIHVFGEI